jgi:hypothetical protein
MHYDINVYVIVLEATLIPGLLKLPEVGKIFKHVGLPPPLPNKVCFRDGRSPKTYRYVFRDISCHADIGKCAKYFYYEQNLSEKPCKYYLMYFYHLRRLKKLKSGGVGCS